MTQSATAYLDPSRSLVPGINVAAIDTMALESDSAPEPAAFLVPDDRVPHVVRALLLEAEGCLRHGFLTGGTACLMRALQALLANEDVRGDSDAERLALLAKQHPTIPELFIAILSRLTNSASRDYGEPDAPAVQLLVVTLKAIAYEIYVVGPERTAILSYILRSLHMVERDGAIEYAPGTAEYVSDQPPATASAQ